MNNDTYIHIYNLILSNMYTLLIPNVFSIHTYTFKGLYNNLTWDHKESYIYIHIRTIKSAFIYVYIMAFQYTSYVFSFVPWNKYEWLIPMIKRTWKHIHLTHMHTHRYVYIYIWNMNLIWDKDHFFFLFCPCWPKIYTHTYTCYMVFNILVQPSLVIHLLAFSFA